MKSKMMRLAARMGEKRSAYKV